MYVKYRGHSIASKARTGACYVLSTYTSRFSDRKNDIIYIFLGWPRFGRWGARETTHNKHNKLQIVGFFADSTIRRVLAYIVIKEEKLRPTSWPSLQVHQQHQHQRAFSRIPSGGGDFPCRSRAIPRALHQLRVIVFCAVRQLHKVSFFADWRARSRLTTKRIT